MADPIETHWAPADMSQPVSGLIKKCPLVSCLLESGTIWTLKDTRLHHLKTSETHCNKEKILGTCSVMPKGRFTSTNPFHT